MSNGNYLLTYMFSTYQNSLEFLYIKYIWTDCGVLPLLIGGLYTYNTTTYGGTMTAECNDGHDLYGSNIRQCLETGEWNGTTTTCVIKGNFPSKTYNLKVNFNYGN